MYKCIHFLFCGHQMLVVTLGLLVSVLVDNTVNTYTLQTFFCHHIHNHACYMEPSWPFDFPL